MKNKNIKFGSDRKDIIIYILLSFIVGFLINFLLHDFTDKHKRESFKNQNFFESRYSEDYDFVSPLLECDSFESSELAYFDEEIKQVSDNLMQNGTIEDISYYFRDLNNGVWIGINEYEKFAPASLMKLPLMISYFKQSEEDPSIFSQAFIFGEEDDNYGKQNIVPEQVMSIGAPYTVPDLIYRMIVFSDNSALRMLLKNSGAFGLRVFEDLGVDIPESDNDEDFIDVRTYSRFFRVLYNASYLNIQDSNKALEILSETQFKDGLVAGVPSNIVVAHKFGEREKDGIRQLHDCGIVYHPNKPCVICIMTRGKDFDRLESAISEISKKTFESVDSVFK